jgi:hypothetical protein
VLAQGITIRFSVPREAHITQAIKTSVPTANETVKCIGGDLLVVSKDFAYGPTKIRLLQCPNGKAISMKEGQVFSAAEGCRFLKDPSPQSRVCAVVYVGVVLRGTPDPKIVLTEDTMNILQFKVEPRLCARRVHGETVSSADCDKTEAALKKEYENTYRARGNVPPVQALPPSILTPTPRAANPTLWEDLNKGLQNGNVQLDIRRPSGLVGEQKAWGLWVTIKN